MSPNTFLARHSALIAALTTLDMTPITVIAKTPRFEGIQIDRYVLESTKLRKFTSYASKIASGTLTYDKNFRHPSNPPGPALIDCETTQRIGVTYIIKRSNRFRFDNVKAKYVWTHSHVNSADFDLTLFHSKPYVRGQDVALYSSGIELTDELRVNGTISLRVTVGKWPILENSFALNNCTRPN